MKIAKFRGNRWQQQNSKGSARKCRISVFLSGILFANLCEVTDMKRSVALLLEALFFASLSLAKIPTIRITISGNGLNTSVNANEQRTIEKFNPYTGGFLGKRIPLAPSCSITRYEVVMYLEGATSSGVDRRRYFSD